jgi:hypothetical protein
MLQWVSRHPFLGLTRDNKKSITNGMLQWLDAAIATDGSLKGNAQLFNPNVGGRQIVAQRGFNIAFLQQIPTQHGIGEASITLFIINHQHLRHRITPF